MTRNIPAGLDAVVAGEVVRWAVLLELGFDSGNVNVWSGTGDLIWNSKTWKGVGAMGSISGVTEATDLSDTLIEASLKHIPDSALPDLVAEVTTGNPVGRPFKLFLAFFKEDTTVEDVLTLTAGTIDEVTLSDGEAGGINIRLATDAALLRRLTFFRLDDQHQQFLFPGDVGLEFVTSLDEEIIWGAAPTQKINVKKGSDSGDQPEVDRGFRR